MVLTLTLLGESDLTSPQSHKGFIVSGQLDLQAAYLQFGPANWVTVLTIKFRLTNFDIQLLFTASLVLETERGT